MRWWETYGPFAPWKACAAYPGPGGVVAFYRLMRNLSRAQVANHLNISLAMLCRMERQNHCLNNFSTLSRLQSLLDIPPILLGLSDGAEAADLGSVIKAYRKQKHWTQIDLAESLGLSDTAVKCMENKSMNLNSLSPRRAF